MQTTKPQGQAAKGSAPLAFQLSSPPKLARQNVLATVRPQVFDKIDTTKGLSESSSAASGKSRPKKSRWGPDQLATSPPTTSGQAPLPALGFKGVNSHRPPGLLLPPKSGTSAGPVTSKPASEDHGAVTQPEPISHRPPNSITVEQPVAGTQKDAEVVQRSLPGHGSHSTISEGKTASQVPHASSSSSRLPSDRERSRETKRTEVADHGRATPSPGAAAHRKHMRASSVENGQTEARPRARSRDRAVSRSPAVDTPHKHTRHSDDHMKHRQPEAEGRLHISPTGSDRLHAHTREQQSSTGYRREAIDGKTSNVSGTRESDRRRGSHALRNVNSDKGRPRSRSPAGSRRLREPRHRSPSYEEEGQIVDRSAARSQTLSATDYRQPYRKLDLVSAHKLPHHASSERSKHAAPAAAAAPIAEGQPAVGLQQAGEPDQPLHRSADTQQVQAAPVSVTQSRPQQADFAVIAASATLPTANTNADIADGRAAHLASAHPPDIVKHADANTQQSQSDTQKGGHRKSDVQAPKHCIVHLPEESAPPENHKVTAASTSVQGSSHRAVAPSGSRHALQQQQQQQPRRRREFHDEPMPSGPGFARKRSQTPEVEFGRDAKRSRHAWQPTPAHAGHAEHRMPSQGAPRNDAHRGPNAFAAKQGDVHPGVSNHRCRDSQSPTPRSVGRGPVAAGGAIAPPGKHADSTRSMSRSPSQANSRNRSLEHLHGGAPGPPTAPHGRTWGADKLHNSHPRGYAPQASFAQPPRFDRQQDHRPASWSNRDYSRGSHENGNYKDHDREFDRRSRSSDRGMNGKDMSRQRQPPISEHEAAVMSRAQKLDSDLDHMLAGLLKAFERAPEAVGNKLVLQQISSSVRLTEHIDGGGGGDYDGKPAFTVTRQSLPGWLHGPERQQLQKMLVPADWLTQDPQFQPRQRLPLGWCPPECTRESMQPGSLDDPTRAAIEADGAPLCDGNPVTIPWQAEEAEAGEVAQDSRDPRTAACTALLPHIVLPMPLFPFLPEGEAPLSMSDISPDFSQGKVEGDKADRRVDQLAPGGFLYDYWDMAHRPPSPTGSWSSSPTRHSGWGTDSAGAWGPSAHLEAPSAPTHFTNTEQPYVEHVTTTALPHGSELTDQHSRMAAGHPVDAHQQQQQPSPPPGQPRPPQPPLTPQLWRPAHYPEPESAYYRLQFGDKMSAKEYGLVQLRQEMAQGREDARPGSSLQNKAEGYWIPLQQGQWKPEHLHWEGIDQMLMQGASPLSEGPDASPMDSECELDTWLAQTAQTSQQRLHPRCQPSQQPEFGTEDDCSSAMVGNNALGIASPTSMSQASSATDLLPEALWESNESSVQWFDSHVAVARKSSTGASSEGHSVHAEAGRSARCWGPPPPPQYSAMLRGELALAVMTGVAGKSLLKEVSDRAIQQQLSGTKV